LFHVQPATAGEQNDDFDPSIRPDGVDMARVRRLRRAARRGKQTPPEEQHLG
jgi:hypothetical protein